VRMNLPQHFRPRHGVLLFLNNIASSYGGICRKSRGRLHRLVQGILSLNSKPLTVFSSA
jgi:hypothetical protein